MNENLWHGHRWQSACVRHTATSECHKFVLVILPKFIYHNIITTWIKSYSEISSFRHFPIHASNQENSFTKFYASLVSRLRNVIISKRCAVIWPSKIFIYIVPLYSLLNRPNISVHCTNTCDGWAIFLTGVSGYKLGPLPFLDESIATMHAEIHRMLHTHSTTT